MRCKGWVEGTSQKNFANQNRARDAHFFQEKTSDFHNLFVKYADGSLKNIGNDVMNQFLQIGDDLDEINHIASGLPVKKITLSGDIAGEIAKTNTEITSRYNVATEKITKFVKRIEYKSFFKPPKTIKTTIITLDTRFRTVKTIDDATNIEILNNTLEYIHTISDLLLKKIRQSRDFYLNYLDELKK